MRIPQMHMRLRGYFSGNPPLSAMEPMFQARVSQPIIQQEATMGRYALLWLLGVPLPVLLLIWMFGGLN
jgi:hypothetical protein